MTTSQAVSSEPNEHDRAHLFTIDAVIMLALLSIVSGLIFGVAVMIIAAICGARLFWAWGATVFAVVIAIAWVLFLGRWFGLTAPIERTTVYEQTAPMPQVVRLEVTSDGGKRTQFADIPTTPEKLALFARGLQGGRPLALREWSGSKKPFSQAEYQAMIDTMITRGWMRWKDEQHPQQGVELTSPGKAVMRTLAGENQK